VLLDLHGAGVVVPDRSLDAAVLHTVRRLQPEAVVAVTMDLHANVPQELTGLADIVVGYREYPHLDAAERARQAAELAFAAARGTVRPVVRHRRVPLLLPPSPTVGGTPAGELRDLVRALEKEPGVLACTVFHGFPYADTEQAAASVVTVTDRDAGLAAHCGERVADWLEGNRERFRIPELTPEDAVRQALGTGGEGPVVIADGTDNPGCGAPGDSTYLLRELIAADAPSCLATLWDPESVSRATAAGPGATVELRLGGRHGWASGPPVEVRGTVRALTDGRIVQTAMRRGKRVDFGRCARIGVGSTEVIVASERRQVFDPEILYLHGIVPQRYRILAVKSVNHFRAGFAEIGGRLLVADAPGPASRQIDRIPRRGPTGSLWPMGGDGPT
jgi:microcystin degradation protein MlrC